MENAKNEEKSSIIMTNKVYFGLAALAATALFVMCVPHGGIVLMGVILVGLAVNFLTSSFCSSSNADSRSLLSP